MKLGNQAIGALMMALQKSLMEQSDIVPMLSEMDFQIETVDEDDITKSVLLVVNPPVVSFDGVTPPFTIEEAEEQEGEK